MLSKTTQKYFLGNFQYTRSGGKVLKGSNAETDTNGIPKKRDSTKLKYQDTTCRKVLAHAARWKCLILKIYTHAYARVYIIR